MSTNMTEQEMMKKAKERVGQKIGLIVHIICWIVISIVISLAVPEKAFGIRIGILVFLFWGICILIHILAYCLSSNRVTKKYDNAVQREYERMKSQK